MLAQVIRRSPAAAQVALTGLALARLSAGRDRRDPLSADAVPDASVSVVIPARNEELRLAGVLGPLRAAPHVREVIVVDDRSEDGTAQVARAHGARVIDGAELPPDWVGKPWALQQGLIAATGEIVVFLDADVQPSPELPAAVAAALAPGAGADLASGQLGFSVPGLGQRLLHPALLATLIYRLGPLDTSAPQPAGLAAINGQCFAARRQELLAAGGFGLIAGSAADDVALARALARAGWRVAAADASHLGRVEMYGSAREALREWAGRSLALPGAASPPRQAVDLALIWAVQGLPGLRLWRALLRAARTGSVGAGLRTLGPLTLLQLAVRAALQLALTRVYRREVAGRSVPDPVALAAPLTDPIAAVALTRGTVAPVRRWRGRELPGR